MSDCNKSVQFYKQLTMFCLLVLLLSGCQAKTNPYNTSIAATTSAVTTEYQTREITIHNIVGVIRRKVSGSSEWQPVTEGMVLTETDVLQAESEAKFTLGDHLQISMDKLAQMEITRLTENDDKPSIALGIQQGSILVNPTIEPDDFSLTIETPLCTLKEITSAVAVAVTPEKTAIYAADGDISLDTSAALPETYIPTGDETSLELGAWEQLVLTTSIETPKDIVPQTIQYYELPDFIKAQLAALNPLKPEAITYAAYLSLEPDDSILKGLQLFGTGDYTREGDLDRWIWRNGDKLISAVANNGHIEQLVQKELSEAKVNLDLTNIFLRERIMACDSLESLKAVFPIDGEELTQLKMEDGSIVRMLQWTDPSGKRYRATINDTTGVLDHSF